MIEILIVAAIGDFGVLSWCLRRYFLKHRTQSSNCFLMRVTSQGWHHLAKWLKPKMAAGCGGELCLF